MGRRFGYQRRRRGARRQWPRKRHYYRRRVARGYKRFRKWRRRRRPAKVRALTEIWPRFMRKCTIRGVYCALCLGQGSNAHNLSSTNHEFNPVRRFDTDTSNTYVSFGGWSVGSFTLQRLYQEHQHYRNRWSASNCGFDLVRYRGTTLFLEQHAKLDYIFFVDPEYETTEAFIKQATMHPLALITHPQSVLIKSRERAGPRRSRKIFVPRPAWWDSGWDFSKHIAQKGLFIYIVFVVDLDYPWFESYFDRAINQSTVTDQEWWRKGIKVWKDSFDDYTRKTVDTKPSGTTTSITDNNTIGAGPFFYKPRNAEDWKYNEQITFFYKSYWHWGGRNLTIKKICDPTLDIHN
nr:ORF1 [Torque teno felis virus]